MTSKHSVNQDLDQKAKESDSIDSEDPDLLLKLKKRQENLKKEEIKQDYQSNHWLIRVNSLEGKEG